MEMTTTLTRRTFLADLGRGGVALAVFSLIGCGPAASVSPAGGSASAAASDEPTGSDAASASAGASAEASGGAGEAVTWARVNLGFVSAYVLVRGGEAAVIDTGTVGSEDAIEA